MGPVSGIAGARAERRSALELQSGPWLGHALTGPRLSARVPLHCIGKGLGSGLVGP